MLLLFRELFDTRLREKLIIFNFFRIIPKGTSFRNIVIIRGKCFLQKKKRKNKNKNSATTSEKFCFRLFNVVERGFYLRINLILTLLFD